MLNIESAEEAAVAMAAVEEFRQTQIRHVGLHVGRLNYPCEQTTREKAFADEWAKEASRRPGINSGYGALEWLLCTEPRRNKSVRDLTPAEATAAATVIQWLGTNCGWCFLCTVIRAAGYSEPRKIEAAR